jgi:hypothetical protein
MAGAGRAKARTVTGMVVGSSAWFGVMVCFRELEERIIRNCLGFLVPDLSVKIGKIQSG